LDDLYPTQTDRSFALSSDGDGEDEPKLDWKDYVAMTLALLQTAVLPYVILVATVVLVAVIFEGILRV